MVRTQKVKNLYQDPTQFEHYLETGRNAVLKIMTGIIITLFVNTLGKIVFGTLSLGPMNLVTRLLLTALTWLCCLTWIRFDELPIYVPQWYIRKKLIKNNIPLDGYKHYQIQIQEINVLSDKKMFKAIVTLSLSDKFNKFIREYYDFGTGRKRPCKDEDFSLMRLLDSPKRRNIFRVGDFFTFISDEMYFEFETGEERELFLNKFMDALESASEYLTYKEMKHNSSLKYDAYTNKIKYNAGDFEINAELIGEKECVLNINVNDVLMEKRVKAFGIKKILQLGNIKTIEYTTDGKNFFLSANTKPDLINGLRQIAKNAEDFSRAQRKILESFVREEVRRNASISI